MDFFNWFQEQSVQHKIYFSPRVIQLMFVIYSTIKTFCCHTSVSLSVCIDKTRVCDFFPRTPVNTDTPLIWTFWHVPLVSVLTGFHCIWILGKWWCIRKPASFPFWLSWRHLGSFLFHASVSYLLAGIYFCFPFSPEFRSRIKAVSIYQKLFLSLPLA